jgi:hypothetical protein
MQCTVSCQTRRHDQIPAPVEIDGAESLIHGYRGKDTALHANQPMSL